MQKKDYWSWNVLKQRKPGCGRFNLIYKITKRGCPKKVDNSIILSFWTSWRIWIHYFVLTDSSLHSERTLMKKSFKGSAKLMTEQKDSIIYLFGQALFIVFQDLVFQLNTALLFSCQSSIHSLRFSFGKPLAAIRSMTRGIPCRYLSIKRLSRMRSY